MATASSANDVGTDATKDLFKKQRAIWIVLVVGLMITATATLYMKSSVEKIAEKDFADNCSEIKTKISERIEDHARILRGGVAFLNASDTVTRDKWQIYTQRLSIEKELPGIQGIGFSVLIPRNELPGHINEIRSQGFPEYTVRPDGERELYSSIIYLEPFSGRNLRAFGYDMFSEPVRRAAMERARDTNDAALSGKVVLIQETEKDVQAGTLMYVPVYRKGMPIETVEQRRAAIYGWVYSPYRMKDLMQGILGIHNAEKKKKLNFQIFDGEQPSPESVLYSSHPDEDVKLFSGAQYSKLVPVDFNGRRWTLRFTQTGGGFSSVEYIRAWLTLLGGVLVTLLLFILTRTLQNTRAEAQRIAENLTADVAKLLENQRIILDTMPIGVSFLKDRKVQLANPAHDLIFGYEVGETFGMNTSEFYSNNEIYARIGNEGYATISTGGIYTTETEMKKKDGSLIWCRLTGRAVNEGKFEDGSIWMIQDVTSLKQAEDDLSTVSKRLLSVVESTGDVVAMMDTEYRYTLFNTAFHDEFKNIFGKDLKPGDSMLEALAHLPDDLANGKECWDRAILGGEDFIITQQFGDTKLERNWYELHFSPIRDNQEKIVGAVHIVRNITERKKSEEAVQQLLHEKSIVLENAGVGITFVQNRQFKWINSALCKMFGYSPKEIIGACTSLLYPSQEDYEQTGQKAYSELAAGRTFTKELLLQRSDGSLFHALYNGKAVNPADPLAGSIWIISDETERYELQVKLVESRNAAESANTAKSQFLANMSHEIRTPMNGLLGMTQLLELTELTEEQRDYVAALKLSGKNLLSLISDILDLSKIEAGKFTIEMAEFSLHHCINDIVLMQKTVAIEKHLALDLNLSKDIPPLLVGDQLRIKQILLNLLGNALKFTPQGHITLSTEILEQQDNFVLIQIAVRDSGIGISPESLDTIFRPFTQEDGSISRKFGGTGLGLTISLRLAELMGGTIRVESSQGVGSCFTVTLPFAVGRETATIQPVTSITTVGWDGPPLRILFAEDDLINIKFGSTLLKKMGFDVTVVENGRDCLTALEQGSFDLVLMDIQMPVMNGDEALKEIRTKEQGTTNHQPVIAVTAYSMRGDMEKFRGEDFDGYVSKPLITRELVAEIKRVLECRGE